MAKYTALQVANWFLKYEDYMQISEESDGISNLKLQKLLYYAQGAYLATHEGAPLFDDPIIAWKHGPVINAVYQAFKGYGAMPISASEDFDASCIEQDDADLLVEVYNTFGQYSAWKLRNMTHNETPWKETKNNEEIPQTKIYQYFVENYLE